MSLEKKESIPTLKNMINALTIDVEDYFQVHAFAHVVPFANWDRYESRVERNTIRILDILDGEKFREKETLPQISPVKGTFFVLGWTAERYPSLIKEIHRRGHEIGCHGYAHKLIYRQSLQEFRADVCRAKGIIEDIVGEKIIGYRAPSYSIMNDNLWVFEILEENGFEYDSSIFPIRHDFYGLPKAPRFPFRLCLNGRKNLKSEDSEHENKARAPLIEFPISTAKVWGVNIPIAGGGYFRWFPYRVVKRFMSRINEKEKMPFVFYLHPWEIDPDQPRIRKAGLKSRFRHYKNLEKTEGRFKELLRNFRFDSMKNILGMLQETNRIGETWGQN